MFSMGIFCVPQVYQLRKLEPSLTAISCLPSLKIFYQWETHPKSPKQNFDSSFSSVATRRTCCGIKSDYPTKQHESKIYSIFYECAPTNEHGRGSRNHSQRLSTVCMGTSSVPLPPAHVDFISSVTNPFVKHLVKLRTSRGYREENGSMLLCGEVVLREALGDPESLLQVRALLLAESAPEPHPLEILHPERVIRVSEAVLKKVGGVENASSLMAAAEVVLPRLRVETLTPQQLGGRILALDGVRDPGNLGTLIRTALAFGWTSVVLLPSCCDPFNDKAVRAARGGSFKIPIFAVSWEMLYSVLTRASVPLYAAGVSGTSAESVLQRGEEEEEDGGRGLCLVLGAEGQGLSVQVEQACEPVTIPMPGNMESLNVAVAGGILMYLLRSPE